MSICSSGLSSPGPLQPVTIAVAPIHPLIQLAQVIPWQALAQLVLPDLQHTTAKRKWWIGRKLQLRIHLGAFLLQWLYNLTDRRPVALPRSHQDRGIPLPSSTRNPATSHQCHRLLGYPAGIC
jgi:hypothetical protein